MTKQLTLNLIKSDIAVVITSALYAGRLGETLGHVDPFRLQRLQQTITTIQGFQFGKIIVIDATLADDFDGEAFLQYKVEFVKAKSTIKKSENEYQIYGPSRLEIDLMDNSASSLAKLLNNYKYVLKLSAGYSISNLKPILAIAYAGVVYRFGNPFRRKIRFCLSSFYILPTGQFISFISYAAAKMDIVAKTYPLEAVLYDFIKTIKTKGITIDYPVINATFLSSQTDSNAKSFKIKLKVYQVLAKLGLYAKSVSEINHPITISSGE